MSIYIYYNQQTMGPYEENALLAWLQTGQISPDALACPHGSTQWRPLRTLFPVPGQPAAFTDARPPGASPVPANVQEQPKRGTCEKCGQREGHVYSFTFGRRGAHTMRRVGHTNIHTVRYAVEGEKYVAACDRCIQRRRITILVVFGLMTVVGAVLALRPFTFGMAQFVRAIIAIGDIFGLHYAEAILCLKVIGGILGLIGLRLLLPNLFSSKTTHAENLIIALKKRELRKQGFNTFWNTKNYLKLRRG